MVEMRAVALLSYWKTRNSLRQVLTDPRKFVPFMVFTGFLLLSCFGALAAPISMNNLPQGNSITAAGLRAGMTALMTFIGLGAINVGLSETVLAFAMSDVDYLFPSPTSRRVIIAYKLPGLTLSSAFTAGFIYFFISMGLKVLHPSLPHTGRSDSPGWFAPLTIMLCVGTYLNLAMFISLRVHNRKQVRRGFIACLVVLFVVFAFIGWKHGISGVESILNSQIFRWAALPAALGGDVLFAGYAHLPASTVLLDVFVVYLLSLLPMFLVTTNWFEQSIVSAESAAAFRKAAKGGLTALRAAQSMNVKHKALRPYTISPFGTGAGALFWAHLCAALKRSWSNFIAPLLAGLALGTLPFLLHAPSMPWSGPGRQSLGTGELDTVSSLTGIALIVALGFYSSMIFLAIGRAASESAIKRNEMLTPLPISSKRAILANLGVPGIAFCLFSWGVALSYLVLGENHSLEVGLGFGLLLPMRTFARMTLQYLVVIGYPDFSDTLQQVLANGVYFLSAFPFFLLEVVVGVVGYLIHGVLGTIVSVTIIQIPIFIFVLFLTGKASEKAVATGEPVSLMSLLSAK